MVATEQKLNSKVFATEQKLNSKVFATPMQSEWGY